MPHIQHICTLRLPRCLNYATHAIKTSQLKKYSLIIYAWLIRTLAQSHHLSLLNKITIIKALHRWKLSSKPKPKNPSLGQSPPMVHYIPRSLEESPGRPRGACLSSSHQGVKVRMVHGSGAAAQVERAEPVGDVASLVVASDARLVPLRQDRG